MYHEIWGNGGFKSIFTLVLDGGECSCCSHITCRRVPWCPMSRRLGGSLSLSGCTGEEKSLKLQIPEQLSMQFCV